MPDAWESGLDVVRAVQDRVDAGKTESGARGGSGSKPLAENPRSLTTPGAGLSQVLLSRAVCSAANATREQPEHPRTHRMAFGFPQSTVSSSRRAGWSVPAWAEQRQGPNLPSTLFVAPGSASGWS